MNDRFLVSVARNLSPRLIGLAFMLAIGLVALAGASLVAAQRGGEPGDPPAPPTFHGCVNNHTGLLRIVDSGRPCQDHETAIALGSTGGDTALLERIVALEQQALAQQGEIDSLTLQNSEQQGAITNLTSENQEQQGEIDALALRVAALEEGGGSAQLPACLTTEAVTGQERPDIVFDGCNVHVRSGAGETGAEVNGLGNLIVGYNEDTADQRTGSHNLVIGPGHTYTSYGGLVAGGNNEISGEASTVTGGHSNTASGAGSSVSGGSSNTASATSSSISGGSNNTASADLSSVSGGSNNDAKGNFSTIGGGSFNTTEGNFSAISGGSFNVASGEDSSVSGGTSNTAEGNDSSVSGGTRNTSSGLFSSVSGGRGNTAEGPDSSVSGGEDNTAIGDHSSIGGGFDQEAGGEHQFLP